MTVQDILDQVGDYSVCKTCNLKLIPRKHSSGVTYYPKYFCSKSCMLNLNKEKKETVCVTCGDTFYVKKSIHIGKYKNCSKECRLMNLKKNSYFSKNRTKYRLNNLGKKHSEETLKKMSEARKIFWQEWRKNNPRELTPYYGLVRLYEKIRHSKENRLWKNSILTRDKFKCQHCGIGEEGDLQVDHIKPFAQIINEYKIRNIVQARNCKELWNLNNGRVLCLDCHKSTPTYFYKLSKNLKIKTL